MLAGRGFERVYNVEGGINAWKGAKARGPRELDLDLITGEESPSEMIVVAYVMENALQTFYERARENAETEEVRNLLIRLGGYEERHKKMLSSFYSREAAEGPDQELDEAGSNFPERMEGGFDVEQFLEDNQASFATLEGILDLAMMLETQSLDLFHRFADKSVHAETRDILLEIATEEKAHLSQLGNMFETFG